MLNLLARIGFAALVALPVYAQAETGDAPSVPDRNPFRAKSPATAEQPAAKPVLPGDRPTVAWSDDEVAAAKLDCAKLLSGVTLDYQPLPPLKEGICGAPAPILVKSIAGVAIEPSATMTCALASGVATWISKTVQPQAKAHARHAGRQAAQRHLLRLPQPLWRRDDAAQRARARQCAGCVGVRVRVRRDGDGAGELAACRQRAEAAAAERDDGIDRAGSRPQAPRRSRPWRSLRPRQAPRRIPLPCRSKPRPIPSSCRRPW